MDDAAFSAELSPLPDRESLKRRWLALEGRAAPSFFLRWLWMESWLDATGARPMLLAIKQQDEDIALAFIGRTRRSNRIGKVDTLLLNEVGSRAADRAFIEYNGLLCAPEHAERAARIALDHLMAQPGWSALRLAGLAPDNALLGAARFRRCTTVGTMPVHYVPLDAVRERGDYPVLLGSSTRSQVRQALRRLGGADVRIDRAADTDTALSWLTAMRDLNQGRHQDNAWEEPGFRAFVQALVQGGMADGSVDLLRFTRGGRSFGYLLNFLQDGAVMNYQSAFDRSDDMARARPGLAAQALAVAHYVGQGHHRYSFLAGNDQYKRNLGLAQEELVWVRCERFAAALEAEYWLRRLLRRPVSA